MSGDHASPRRNEIAHGVVLPYRSFVYESDIEDFCLGPSIYITSKRRLYDQPLTLTPELILKNTKPTYLYSSKEIDKIGDQFETILTDEAIRICRTLFDL